MTRIILNFVFTGMILAGFEGAADAAGSALADSQDHGHEIHGSIHADSHEHNGESDHDDHFCHCGVHAAALLCVAVTSGCNERYVSSDRYDSRFSSLIAPPLLRPPNS